MPRTFIRRAIQDFRDVVKIGGSKLQIDGTTVTASAAYINAGTGSKATAEQINTGTEDTAYATSKGLADSKIPKAVAAGYRIARGVAAVTAAGSGIATVVTGLTTVVAITA